MPRNLLVSGLAICVVCLGASRAPADDHSDKLLATLKVAKEEFLRDKEAEKQKVLNKFDALITKMTNNSKLKPADKLSLADKWRAERRAFEQNEDLPEDSDLVPWAWQYGTAVVKKHKVLSNRFDQLMNSCIKAGKITDAEKIKADKDSFDQEHMPGRKHFIVGATWTGTRFDGTNGTLFLFRITKFQGTLFNARAEQNLQVGGHPIFDVGGSLDGILLNCTSLRPIQGNVRLARCTGIVLGQTLILQLVTITPKGMQTISYAVLREK